jgi:hypothetical protein
MKILALIIKKEKDTQEKHIIEDSNINSLVVSIPKGGCEATVLNKTIKDLKKEDCSHIVLLPNEAIVYDSYSLIAKEYLEDNKTIYLPLATLVDEEGNFKGIINSSAWWPRLTENPGDLDEKSALNQVDTTLYGGLIPLEIAKKHKFKKGLEIYYHFEFINKVISKSVKVKGIPKLLTKITYDYSLKNISREKKIEMFEAARKEYIK